MQLDVTQLYHSSHQILLDNAPEPAASKSLLEEARQLAESLQLPSATCALEPSSPRRLLGPKPPQCLVLRAPLGDYQWVFTITLHSQAEGAVVSAYSQMLGEPLFQVTYSAEARRRAVHGALAGVEQADGFEYLEAAGREIYQWLVDQLAE